MGTNLPTQLGRRIGVTGYRVAQKIFKFDSGFRRPAGRRNLSMLRSRGCPGWARIHGCVSQPLFRTGGQAEAGPSRAHPKLLAEPLANGPWSFLRSQPGRHGGQGHQHADDGLAAQKAARHDEAGLGLRLLLRGPLLGAEARASAPAGTGIVGNFAMAPRNAVKDM